MQFTFLNMRCCAADGRRCVPYNGESSCSWSGFRGRVQHHESNLSQELVPWKTGHRATHSLQQQSAYNAAFTPDTCSPDTLVSCIHLYPFVSPVAVYNNMYPMSAKKLSSRRYVSTCIRIQVVRPVYLQTATCIWCKRGLTPLTAKRSVHRGP